MGVFINNIIDSSTWIYLYISKMSRISLTFLICVPGSTLNKQVRILSDCSSPNRSEAKRQGVQRELESERMQGDYPARNNREPVVALHTASTLHIYGEDQNEYSGLLVCGVIRDRMDNVKV